MSNSEELEKSKTDPGSHLNVVIGALLEAAGDKEGLVRDSVCAALKNVSNKYRGLLIKSVHQFRPRNPNLSTSHVLIILYVLEHIAQDRKQTLPPELVEMLIELSIKEMTRSDAQPQTQEVASNILISLGNKNCNEVLSGLLPELVPNKEPKPYVVKTFGHLASTNTMSSVPVIKVALDIMVSMMPSTRSEQLRVSFSLAIARFSEAISEYLSSTDDCRDESVTIESFSEQICVAYDIIANSWVQAKEIKVAESSIRALGPLFTLLPDEKAASSTQRAITCLLNAYKRPCISHHIITQCIATVLRAAPPQSIQPSLDAVLFSLGNMVVIPPDYTLPHTVKQHSEVLRCYDHLGLNFSERICDLLIKHLRLGNERDKVEALIVCAHLISSNENTLKERIPEVTSALRGVLSDPSVRVKKALVKAIVSLACKGHASDASDFIEFLVRHCSPLPNFVGNEYNELASMCESTLQLLSSTVDSLCPMMWVVLLKLMTDSSYDASIPVVTQTLSKIAPKIDKTHDLTGEPSRESVLSRCFVLLGSPLNNNRGPPILNFLQQFSSFVSLHISDLWDHKLPQLINYLHVSEWSDKEWESLLIELINNTVTTISCHDSAWPIAVATQLSCLLPVASSQDEASIALSALAITTAVIEDKQVVSGHLDTILSKLKSSNMDIKSCSRAVGILSTAHLDMVLNRLEAIAQSELSRRNSRLLGLMKDSKAEAETEKCREALLQCYASIAQRCPLMELLPKMDSLTDWITSQITLAKEHSGREAALEAILNCAESLVRHKTEAKHRIKNRSQILDVIMRQLVTSKPDPISLQATTALVKLPPDILTEARLHILKSCFDCVLSQEPPSNGFDSSAHLQSLKCLGELVEEMLMSSVTPDRLDEVTTLLEPWVKHRNPYQRYTAIITFRSLLLSYYHHTKPGYQKPSNFNQCGDLLGTLVVRIFDSNSDVGKIAAHCIGLVLAISGLYDGLSHDPNTEKILEELPEENAPHHVAQILLNKLPPGQLHKLTGRLLDGLTDSDSTACSNASDILTSVFIIKGAELFHYVNDILGSLLLQLTSSGGNSTNGVSAVVALAKHHPKLVLSILLKQSLPFHSCLCDCWKSIAHTNELNEFALDFLIQIIMTSELYDDYSNSPHRPKIAALQPLAAVSSLSEMVVVASLNSKLRLRLHQLFPALLCLTAAYIGSSPPVLAPSPTKSSLVITNRDAYRIQPSKVVKDCLQRLLLCIGCDKGAGALVSTTHFQQIDVLISSVPQLTLSVCQSFPSVLPKLLTVMNQYACGTSDSQRIVSTAFYSECLSVQSSSGGDSNLVDSLVSFLLSAISDPDHNVKAIALKGLSAIVHLPPSQCAKHQNGVLGALMQGLDDDDGNVHTKLPLEAMRSLSLLVPVLDNETLLRIQIPLALRLKLFFEKEEIAVRSVSLKMVGLICKSGSCLQQGYKEHVLSSLVTLLLHLSEPEPAVVKACKYTLRETSSVIGNKLGSMFKEHLIDEGNLQFEQFICAIAPLVASELNEEICNMLSTCLTYTKSNWHYIRGNASFLAGVFYKEMSSDLKATVDLDQLVCRLLQMMSDQSREVRSKTAQALGIFFDNF